MEGWRFFCILTQTSFFSESESLCNSEDAIAEAAREEFEAFFPLFFQQPQSQQVLEIVCQSHSGEILVKKLLKLLHITSMLQKYSISTQRLLPYRPAGRFSMFLPNAKSNNHKYFLINLQSLS